MLVILITGASSGIGAALARHYARPGTTIVLHGRHRERLDAVAAACRTAGAEIRVEPLELRDRDAVGAWIRALDAELPLDLVIVNAGVNGGNPTGQVESEARAFETVDINLLGALNVTLPCITMMAARRRGQIALMSSLAAYAPLPDAPSYSGTKAALLAHGLALRQKLQPLGVKVNVITPGYVRTAMGATYKEGWRPLEISAEAAAARIARGLARNRDVVAFPWLLTVLARGAGLVPEWLLRFGMSPFKARIGDLP